VHKRLEDEFKDADDVVFFHIQTVFEGEETNTPENGMRAAKAAGIASPVGYDARVDGARLSNIMTQFGTGGTPWTIVIDKKGEVVFNSVTPPGAPALVQLVEKLRKKR